MSIEKSLTEKKGIPSGTPDGRAKKEPKERKKKDIRPPVPPDDDGLFAGIGDEPEPPSAPPPPPPPSREVPVVVPPVTTSEPKPERPVVILPSSPVPKAPVQRLPRVEKRTAAPVGTYLGRVVETARNIAGIYFGKKKIRRLPRLKVAAESILIIKTGALGDLILTSATFQTLRKEYPSAELALLTHRAYEENIRHSPLFDTIYYFRGNLLHDILRVLLPIRKRKFDLVIDMQGNMRSNYLTLAMNARRRAGFYRIGFGLPLHIRASKPKRMNPVDGQFPLLERLGIREFVRGVTVWSDEEDELYGNLVRTFGLSSGKKRVLVHPFAGPGWETRRWLPGYVTRLADILTARGYEVVVIGKDPEGWLERAVSPTGRNLISLVGKLDFRRLVTLLKNSSVLVSTDSGPLHIGAACGLHVIGLFGPSRPDVHAPPGTRYLYSDVKCSPCRRRRCHRWMCMRLVSADKVVKIIEEWERAA